MNIFSPFFTQFKKKYPLYYEINKTIFLQYNTIHIFNLSHQNT